MVVSLDAQGYAYDQIASMLAGHLNRRCRVVQFPQSGPPENAMGLLDLDDTSNKSLSFLLNQARSDVSLTLSACDKTDEQGQLLSALMKDMPTTEPIGEGSS